MRPLIFGEVLYDVFPDGAVLGGAPLNVAWHLQGLGWSPLLISRVGSDPAGARALEALRAWGLETSGIQTDPRRPTGKVRVRLADDGTHTFDILTSRAYDDIDPFRAVGAARRTEAPGILYHGTLALRADRSREALAMLDAALGVPRFVDVNLRAPWWRPSLVASVLRGATWAKLNEEELGALGRHGGPGTDLAGAAEAFRHRYGLEGLIVTRGADGALLAGREGMLSVPATPATPIIDTVGAGDAFSAVAMVGLMAAWPAETILRRAADFAALVCTYRGAVVDDPGLYRRVLDGWQAEERNA